MLLQFLIHRRGFNRVLGTDRTASDQKSSIPLDCVAGNTTPEKVKQVEIAMLGMHAGAAQLNRFTAKRFVRRKIEFPLAIIAEIRRRQLASLQPISADDVAGRDFLDNQVIAEFIKWIDIEPGRIRFGQSFTEFQVEDLKPQLLGATQFVHVLRQPYRVLWTRPDRRFGFE